MASHTRTYLYVGGCYVENDTGQHVLVDQMYVEKLVPAGGATKRHPIVFIHGQAQTATNWLNKPDGSEGWASFFLAQGYECFLLDQTHRGRSPWTAAAADPDASTACRPRLAVYSAEQIQQRFTAPARYGLWAEAALHTQWPGAGVMGDAVFDAYYASCAPVVLSSSSAAQQASAQAAGAALLDHIAMNRGGGGSSGGDDDNDNGGANASAILVTHSQGAMMGWLVADVRPHLVRQIVALEPKGPPFHEAVFDSSGAIVRPYGLTDLPLTYAPPVTDPTCDLKRQRVDAAALLSGGGAGAAVSVDDDDDDDPGPRRQLANLRRVPVLVVTAEASYHAQYDWCTVRFLQQAGVRAEHLVLADRGVHGNGHMMFLEKNSDEIACLVQQWIERRSI